MLDTKFETRFDINVTKQNVFPHVNENANNRCDSRKVNIDCFLVLQAYYLNLINPY